MSTNLPIKDENRTQEVFEVQDTPRADTNVPVNEYEAINGFFLRKTNNRRDVADGLTDAVMQIANLHNAQPMGLIDELELNDLELSDIQKIIISMINQTRNNTSILGFDSKKTANPSAVRNIMV